MPSAQRKYLRPSTHDSKVGDANRRSDSFWQQVRATRPNPGSQALDSDLRPSGRGIQVQECTRIPILGIQTQESKSGIQTQESNLGIQAKEFKPKNPNPGIQTQESKLRHPNPGFQSQESKPRNPNSGIQTQEYKRKNSKPGIQMEPSRTRNHESGILNKGS